MYDNEIYIEEQIKEIKGRQEQGVLYLEMGGKLLQDRHASRVLPGYDSRNKINILERMKEDIEVLLVINSEDIERVKVSSASLMPYTEEIPYLIREYAKRDIKVSGVVITRYRGQEKAKEYGKELNREGIRVIYHNEIDGYPENITKILRGFAGNEYIEPTKDIIIVSSPGGGSGKLSVCLSQIYNSNRRGVRARYSKFETFPIYDKEPEHPINLAYEAATVDIGDRVMQDPYYNGRASSYNRDISAYPVLKEIMEGITGEEYNESPTGVSVNCVSKGILDDEKVKEASKREIYRRYLKAKVRYERFGKRADEYNRMKELVTRVRVTERDIEYIKVAEEAKQELKSPTVVIDYKGQHIRGKETETLTALSGCVLNLIKCKEGIDKEEHILEPEMIATIQEVKERLGRRNTHLELEEVLILLASNGRLKYIDILEGLEGYSTDMMSKGELTVGNRLGLEITTGIAGSGLVD